MLTCVNFLPKVISRSQNYNLVILLSQQLWWWNVSIFILCGFCIKTTLVWFSLIFVAVTLAITRVSSSLKSSTEGKQKLALVCTLLLSFFTSPAGAVAKYCDELVCLSVCLSVPVWPPGCLWNHTRSLHQFFCACCLWPWLSPSFLLCIRLCEPFSTVTRVT